MYDNWSKIKMNEDTYDALEQLFLSLSDKTRLRLLGLMSGGEVSVGYLADSLGVSQPKISRHLAYLRNAGLVSTRRDGKWIYYAIEPPVDRSASEILSATLSLLGPTAPVAERQQVTYSVVEEMDVFLL